MFLNSFNNNVLVIINKIHAIDRISVYILSPKEEDLSLYIETGLVDKQLRFLNELLRSMKLLLQTHQRVHISQKFYLQIMVNTTIAVE